MKKINKASTAFIALAFANAGVHAQDFNGREHALNVSLTFSSEGETTSSERVSGLTTITNYQNKIVVERLGNRQFLEFLVEEGVIPSISGWSIRYFSSTGGEGYEVGTFIVKRDQDPINVSAYLDISASQNIESVRGRINENETAETYLETGNGNGVAIGNLYLEDELVASGILRTRFAYTIRENGVDETIDELRGGSLTCITGFIEAEEDTDEIDDEIPLALIEGSVRLGEGKRITLPVITPPPVTTP